MTTPTNPIDEIRIRFAVSTDGHIKEYGVPLTSTAKREIYAVITSALPQINYTAEELLAMNQHLDSRSQQSTHDYNRGYIDGVRESEAAVKALFDIGGGDD